MKSGVLSDTRLENRQEPEPRRERGKETERERGREGRREGWMEIGETRMR